MKLKTKDLIELNLDLKKTEKVFKSCETPMQEKNAKRYYELMQMKYWNKYFDDKYFNHFCNEDGRLIINEFRKIRDKHSWKTKQNK